MGLSRLKANRFDMKEIWKNIPSFLGYQASSLGKVRIGSKILTGKCTTKQGYPRSSLKRNGKHVSICTHILVCEAFHGPRPSPKHESRHLDGSKNNMCADNLKWGTKEDNYADSVKHGTYSHGSRHGLAKLNEEIVRQARKEYATGISGRVLAKKYGVSGTVMYFALNKTTWKHV